ncbi:MAG: 16S rRNA (cytosine(967)-C(5))-methyltransferase RsmB [bacterium]|nr:16S rRNA (cytosine(967)-C(5))-methyltransferase RsmB [bacterium]
MPISPARVAAYEILLRVERDRAYASALLPRYEAELGERDAALCHQLVLGVLRRKLYLDSRICNHAGAKKIDIEVLTALRLGAYQLLELDRVPDHSAVNDSVGLVQRARKVSAKGFVNAILRRIAGESLWTGSGESIDEISIDVSHPKWLLERWIRQFGYEKAVAIARANNQASRIAYRLTGRELETQIESERSEIVEGAFTVPRITHHLRKLAEEGNIYFQDEASQLVARLVSIPGGSRLLDVCASPGGKTSLVSIRNPTVSVVAGDIHHWRVEFLRTNCIRQGISSVLVAQYDAAVQLPFAEGAFDTVFIDAPCSGTGTIGSSPEIRYYLDLGDIEELSRKQLLILENASKMVKSGGRLIYATCSLEREENEDVISAFLAGCKDFVPAAFTVDPRFITDEGFGRTFPDRDGTDGFFFAELIRN